MAPRPPVLAKFALRVRDDASGYYAHARGSALGAFDSLDEAEQVRRAMPNGAEFEVVEVEA